MSMTAAALILAWVAIVLLGFAMAAIMQQVRALAVGPTRMVRLGPPLGMPAPLLAELGLPNQATALLVFASSSCRVCREAVENLAALQDLAGPQSVLLIFREDAPPETPSIPSIRRNAKALFEMYAVQSTPFVVRVRDGIIDDASHAGSLSVLRELAARSAAQGQEVA